MDTLQSLREYHLIQEPKAATKFVVDILFNKVSPMMLEIRNKMLLFKENTEEDISKLGNIFTLSSSQLKKCFNSLFEIFKSENKKKMILQESRNFTMQRLYWCLERLETVEEQLDKLLTNSNYTLESSVDSVTASSMYFVNWIDHTFEILANLSNVISKIDYNEIDELTIEVQVELSQCVGSLHKSIDELLLSAMTICRYCLLSDQHIVKARCQVVLRETKSLLNELIDCDIDAAFQANPDSLKLPIKPSNINVLIDVLKDVLYALETNTNTALLALLIDCFSGNMSPIDVLKQHFSDRKDCKCANDIEETSEDCPFVQEFDLYNERLMQIGSFAVSCTSDENRMITLRSGLASLEALDPHLVPALLISPESYHATFLMESWKKEVQDIRDSVFLIVDPGAFADKSKQILHDKVLNLSTENAYNNTNVCSIVNIGCVLYEFFSVYNNYEPEALSQRESLLPMLTDLRKVIMECKLVSNMLSSGDDFVYNVKKVNKLKKEATFEQLLKRIKLLYSVINKINTLLHPKENDDHFFDLDDGPKNVTHTVNMKQINGNTYVNSPKKPVANTSRSIFARTVNVRSSNTNFPLAKLVKHLKAKKCPEISFSVQLDRLFDDLSDVKTNDQTRNVQNKCLEKIRETTFLYKSPLKNRSSLRKAVLMRQKLIPKNMSNVTFDVENADDCDDRESIMDEAMSLQITDVLNQLDDVTNITIADPNSTQILPNRAKQKNTASILRINVNDRNSIVSKRVWNIPVNSSTVEMPLDETVNLSAGTQHSNVTTLERLNDLNFVESKLNSLKTQLETSL